MTDLLAKCNVIGDSDPHSLSKPGGNTPECYLLTAIKSQEKQQQLHDWTVAKQRNKHIPAYSKADQDKMTKEKKNEAANTEKAVCLNDRKPQHREEQQ